MKPHVITGQKAAAERPKRSGAKVDETAKAVHGGADEVEDDGRGLRATNPSEIPARGWKDILLRGLSEHL
jgi:hypothetical protein